MQMKLCFYPRRWLMQASSSRVEGKRSYPLLPHALSRLLDKWSYSPKERSAEQTQVYIHYRGELPGRVGRDTSWEQSLGRCCLLGARDRRGVNGEGELLEDKVMEMHWERSKLQESCKCHREVQYHENQEETAGLINWKVTAQLWINSFNRMLWQL